MSEWFSLEDRNYQNDPRVRARDRRWWQYINEDKKQARDKYDHEDGRQKWWRFTYIVCDLCDGKGCHVNPSVDCDGLTYEDMYDGGYMEDYFDGVYDVTCNLCAGKRVIPKKHGKPIYISKKEENHWDD